jgi:hypothetical protein
LLSKVYSNFHKFIKCFNDRWERRWRRSR